MSHRTDANVGSRDEVGILLTSAQIIERVRELGSAITHDYEGRSLVMVCVLKGSFVFAADLARAITLPLRVEFLGVRSYGQGTKSSGVVQITHDLEHPIEGEDVLLVEDIVDTGKTLHDFLPGLRHQQPASLKIAALLHKPAATIFPLTIDYLAFSIPDKFVVGYGLDYDGLGRNLKEIYQLV